MADEPKPLTPAEVDEIEARSKLARERFMTNPPQAAAPEAVWPSLDDVPRLVASLRAAWAEIERLREQAADPAHLLCGVARRP